MTTVTIEEFRAHLDDYLADASRRDVILTNQGKPWIVLRAIDAQPAHQTDEISGSAAFWQMIQDRRKESGIPWEEAKKDLDLEDSDGVPT